MINIINKAMQIKNNKEFYNLATNVAGEYDGFKVSFHADNTGQLGDLISIRCDNGDKFRIVLRDKVTLHIREHNESFRNGWRDLELECDDFQSLKELNDLVLIAKANANMKEAKNGHDKGIFNDLLEK